MFRPFLANKRQVFSTNRVIPSSIAFHLHAVLVVVFVVRLMGRPLSVRHAQIIAPPKRPLDSDVIKTDPGPVTFKTDQTSLSSSLSSCRRLIQLLALECKESCVR